MDFMKKSDIDEAPILLQTDPLEQVQVHAVVRLLAGQTPCVHLFQLTALPTCRFPSPIQNDGHHTFQDLHETAPGYLK